MIFGLTTIVPVSVTMFKSMVQYNLLMCITAFFVRLVTGFVR